MASSHLSRLALMRLLSGEGAEAQEERQAAEQHLASCPSCARALAELRAVQEEGAREAPPLRLPQPRRPVIAWTALAVAGASAALAALLVVPGGDHGIRRKGGARVEYACKDGPRTWSCRSGERVRPGTAVAVQLEVDAPRWIMLLGRDATGRWRPYLPAAGDRAVEVGAGRRDPLGHSLVLDDQPGEERFVLVIAARAFSVGEVVLDGRAPALSLPEGFEGAELVLVK